MTLSDLIGYLLYPFKQIFFFHKKKALFFILALLLFGLFLFPYSDLSSYSQDKINQNLKSSGGQVTFSEINFNLSPFGIKTSDVVYKSKSLKTPLKVEGITLRPDLLALMRFKPGGSLKLEDLFGGEASLNLSLDGKTNEKTNKFKMSADVEELSIRQILSFLGKSIRVEGAVFGELFGSGEDSFRQQPEGEFKFNLQNVAVPKEISTPIGVVELPKKINWKNSNLFGKFEKGRVSVTNGTLGTKEAPVNGRFKGFINCVFTKSGAQVSPRCTDYNFKVELELNANFQKNVADDLSSFLDPKNVNKTKLPGGGAKYLFSIQGNAATSYRPPKFYRLSNFE